MSSHDHDLPFLTRVHEQLDENPRADVIGRDVAETLGLDEQTGEAVQQRLIRDGYLEKRPVPARMSDTHLDAHLAVTAAGARAANRQQLD